jgi:hypothetical protein
MAEEVIILKVEVDSQAALKRQVELKTSLQSIKEEQAELAKTVGKTSEAYILNEAKIATLNQQLRSNGVVLKEVASNTTAVAGAYAVANKASAEAAQKAKDMAFAYGLSDDRTKAAIKSAKDMSDQLKNVDSSVGQNARKVGDYAGELGRLPGAMGGVAQGSTTLKAGFYALSATPLLGIIQILMVVFGVLSKAMGGGSDSSLKLKQAFAPLTTIMSVFQVVLADVVGWLSKGITVIGDFVSKTLSFIPAVNKMNETTKNTIALEKERQKIAEENRNEIVNDAKDNQKIADLKNKIDISRKINICKRSR